MGGGRVSKKKTQETQVRSANTRAHSDFRGPDGKYLPGIRPPTAWKPGQSGNPLGRPAVEREVTQAARALTLRGLERAAQILEDPKGNQIAQARILEVILERAYGKAPQRVVVETDVAGMSNQALAQYMRAQLEAVSRTIEGQAEEPDDAGS